MSTPTMQAAHEAAVEVATAVIRDSAGAPVAVPAAMAPTQIRHPFKSVLRTTFQAAVALAAMWALIVQVAGLPDWAWVSTSVAVAGGITRVMAIPGVELWLRRFLPFLSAAPRPDDVPPANPLYIESTPGSSVVEDRELLEEPGEA